MESKCGDNDCVQVQGEGLWVAKGWGEQLMEFQSPFVPQIGLFIENNCVH